jgi:polyhydroxybutyrate depolymerase
MKFTNEAPMPRRKSTSVSSDRHIRAYSGRLTVDGRERTFEIISPAWETPRALVLVLHGAHQTGAKVRAFSGRSFDRLAADASSLVIYPDAYKRLWNDARASGNLPARTEGIDDTAFIAALIDRYEDLSVYVAGYSNGGQMAIKLVHEIPDRLSGAVIISATQPTPDNLTVNDRHLPVPVVLVSGTRDPVVPYGGGVTSLWGFGPRGTGLSAPDSARYFAERNGIAAVPSTEQLPHRPESGRTSVTRQRWQQNTRPSVTLYTVINGGHVIPNPTKKAPFIFGRTTRDINAADTVADLMTKTPVHALPL